MNAYTGLITSEHNDKPNFMAMITAQVQPAVDLQATMNAMQQAYDLDAACGTQLDVLGQWIGRPRQLTTPLTGVYFALDTSGVGLDQGTWQGPYDPTSGQTSLADDAYKTLLRATIVANSWNGTVPRAYAAWAVVFGTAGYQVVIQDNCDMSIYMGLLGPSPDAVTLALFEGGYLNLRAAGVGVRNYVTPTLANTPFFGFDAEGAAIAGFDVGAFGTFN